MCTHEEPRLEEEQRIRLIDVRNVLAGGVAERARDLRRVRCDLARVIRARGQRDVEVECVLDRRTGARVEIPRIEAEIFRNGRVRLARRRAVKVWTEKGIKMMRTTMAAMLKLR
jgi:hypothetical protein